jgi:hypothetical protein
MNPDASDLKLLAHQPTGVLQRFVIWIIQVQHLFIEEADRIEFL